MIEIKIPQKPISTNHCYRVRVVKGTPIMYMTKEGKEFKAKAQDIIRDSEVSLTDKDIKLSIELRFKDKRRRDIDNYNKILLDSMTDLVYEDDKQIMELNLKKSSGWLNDEIVIQIEEMI